MTIVESSLHHLDIVLCNGRFLGELLAEEVVNQCDVTVEQPAHQSQCEHVTTLQHGLVVHTRVSQTVLHHLCQRALDDAVGVDAHLAQIILCLKLCLLQVLRPKRVGVNDDCSLRLGKLVLRLQRSCIHGDEHVALVSRRIDLAGTNVYLKTTDTCQRTLRGTDVGRIVGECRNAIAHGSRNRRENVSGQLHTIAGIS